MQEAAMPKVPDALDPISGYVALGVLALIVWLVIWVIRKVAQNKKNDGKHHHSPAPAHDPHHPPKGGGDHGHGHDDHSGGHHGHTKDPLWKTLLVWTCTIVFMLVALQVVILPVLQEWGFGQVPGASRDVRRAIADRRVHTSASQGAGCPANTSSEPIPITAPPKGAARSTPVPMLACHYVRFCDKERDPKCNAGDFVGARFNVGCTLPDGGMRPIIGRTDAPCFTSLTIESEDDSAIEVTWKYVRDPAY